MSSHSVKRTKLTFGLVAVFALLLGVIGWIEIGNQPTNTQINADVKNIIIKRTGHEDITLALSDGDWNMTAPYLLKANTPRIDPLLNLGSASFDGYQTSEVDMPATGLDEPGASIVIGQREFLLGNTDADGERRYTLVDNKVSFVPSWVWSLVHGGVTAFADLTVFARLPNELYLIRGDDVRKLENIDEFSTLQADKIAAWPSSADSTTSNTDPTNYWKLTSSAQIDANNLVANLQRLEDRTLINTEPGYAFVISNARLDALLTP